MKVYVLFRNYYHDTSELLGAFKTLENAERSLPNEIWSRDGYYVHHWSHVISESEERGGDGYLIFEFELCD